MEPFLDSPSNAVLYRGLCGRANLGREPLTSSPSVGRRTRMANRSRTKRAQSSSCMRRKLFLYTALPIASPRRSPAT